MRQSDPSLSLCSIIICAFNPDDEIFARTLNAIAALKIPDRTAVECMLVDNNSQPALGDRPMIQAFLQACPWVKLVVEPQQGLTVARLRGGQVSSGSWMVFIDDDNEPDEEYLNVAHSYLTRYAEVAAWGPGDITVEFMPPLPDQLPEWKEHYLRKIFQERHDSDLRYECVPAAWRDAYPFGTGLVLRRWVFEAYAQAVVSGQLLACDRQGSALTSAGDIQMVWEAIKQSYSAGVIPELRMRHVISSSRCHDRYIQRLKFGTSVSYLPALTQSFPEARTQLEQSIPKTIHLCIGIFKELQKNASLWKSELMLWDAISYIGHYVGFFRAIDSQQGKWLEQFAQWMDLK